MLYYVDSDMFLPNFDQNLILMESLALLLNLRAFLSTTPPTASHTAVTQVSTIANGSRVTGPHNLPYPGRPLCVDWVGVRVSTPQIPMVLQPQLSSFTRIDAFQIVVCPCSTFASLLWLFLSILFNFVVYFFLCVCGQNFCQSPFFGTAEVTDFY